MKRIKKRYKILGAALVALFLLSLPEIFYKNKGLTKSIGSVRDGKLENAYLVPYSGENWSYFSPFSYYILDNAYTHHKVHKTIIDAYTICEKTCPDKNFKLMETSHEEGGRMHFHRTHQNGMSADFMVPKMNSKGKQTRWLDHIGLSHYLLAFDDEGTSTLSGNTKIDFETIGKHILALDKSARENGLRIRKIILKIALKDDLYATNSGKEIKKRGIYIVQGLSHIVDILHDDHYHIDFELR